MVLLYLGGDHLHLDKACAWFYFFIFVKLCIIFVRSQKSQSEGMHMILILYLSFTLEIFIKMYFIKMYYPALLNLWHFFFSICGVSQLVVGIDILRMLWMCLLRDF